jgi:hypothetical protein
MGAAAASGGTVQYGRKIYYRDLNILHVIFRAQQIVYYLPK